MDALQSLLTNEFLDQARAHYHTGFWINWSRGRVIGSVITLPANQAKLLSSFLTAFTTLSVASTWVLISFLIHQSKATTKDKDGLHHQRQAVLRNTGSSFSTLRKLIALSWAWRENTHHGLLRQLPVMIAATLHIIAFLAAGTLTGYLVNYNDEVLIRSENCGFPAALDWNENDLQAMVNFRSTYQRAAAYVRSCTGPQLPPGTASACGNFPLAKINVSVTSDVPCPFDGEVCYSAPGSRFRFESEAINSNQHLGINAPDRDHVEYHKASVCTAITDWDGSVYVKNRSAQSNDGEIPGSLIWEFHYYINNDLATFTADPATQGVAGVMPYSIIPAIPNFVNFNNSYPFSDDFRVAHSDLHLALLIKNIQYSQSFPEILFGVENNQSSMVVDSYQKQWWRPSPFNVFACTEQHRFCNPSSKQCTQWGGLFELGRANSSNTNYPGYTLGDNLGLNSQQQALVSLIAVATRQSSYDSLFATTGGAMLLAQEQILSESHPYSGPLHSNQTLIEFSNFFDITLANLQRRFLERPNAPSGIQLGDSGAEGESRALCHQQMIRDVGYASVSVLGLSLILILSVLLIALSFCIAPVTGFLKDKLRRKRNAKHEWDSEELLQLQRAAYEAQGIGTWSGGPTDIPLPAPSDRFGLPRQQEDLGDEGGESPEVLVTQSKSKGKEPAREALLPKPPGSQGGGSSSTTVVGTRSPDW